MAEVLQVQSLDRALDIIEALCRANRGMAIRDLADATRLNKSTVYRMLQTLRRRGFVMQDEDTGRYYMTTRLYDLGNQVVQHLDILENCPQADGTAVYCCWRDNTLCDSRGTRHCLSP